MPEDTTRVARAASRRGNPHVLLRDKLGAVFADADFADLYPKLGQPAYAPWRLAPVTLLQFREGLSDRQAAEAVAGSRACACPMLAPSRSDPPEGTAAQLPGRDAYAVQVGADGFLLLDTLDGAEAPEGAGDLPEVAVPRRVWARHFGRVGAGSGDSTGGNPASGGRLRPAQGRGPGDRVESPHDAEARFRSKAGTNWTGYMVHFTESCDAGAPHLIVHADATPANVHEAMRVGPIHAALAARGLAPSEHLADAGYVSAAHLVAARERHAIDLVGPARPDQSWQKQVGGAFRAAGFAVDWERRQVRCPEGHGSTSWGECKDHASGRSCIRTGFSPADCRPCPSRPRCTRAASRQLGLLPRPEHEAIAAVRARLETKAGRRLYGQRRGIEGTISQGVRAFGLRRARYRGLAKMGLQSMAAAAAINLDRLGAWFARRPLAQTRRSRFAAPTA